jgi:hypothetical protein
MTRYYDQDIKVVKAEDFIEVRVGDLGLMLTVDQAKDLVARIESIIPKPEMILRPEKPNYRLLRSEIGAGPARVSDVGGSRAGPAGEA